MGVGTRDSQQARPQNSVWVHHLCEMASSFRRSNSALNGWIPELYRWLNSVKIILAFRKPYLKVPQQTVCPFQSKQFRIKFFPNWLPLVFFPEKKKERKVQIMAICFSRKKLIFLHYTGFSFQNSMLHFYSVGAPFWCCALPEEMKHRDLAVDESNSVHAPTLLALPTSVTARSCEPRMAEEKRQYGPKAHRSYHGRCVSKLWGITIQLRSISTKTHFLPRQAEAGCSRPGTISCQPPLSVLIISKSLSHRFLSSVPQVLRTQHVKK